jgi:uncharacterized phage protein gp47/JayE
VSLSLASLLRTRTQAEIRGALLSGLGAVGFPVTSWRSGGRARTLVETTAAGLVDLWNLGATVVLGLLLDSSERDWLTALAKSHFDVERAVATFAAGYVRLTAPSGVGPYQIAPGALVVSDGTRFYRSTNGASLTLSAGSYLDVPVRAEGVGSAYNAPSITVLTSPALPGVALTSPAYGGGASWRTFDGADEESDAALKARCRAKWSTLGRGATLAAYEYIATSCPDAPSITRARAITGSHGRVAVYVATSTGPASTGAASIVQAWVTTRAAGTDLVTVSPTPSVLVSLAITIATTDTSASNEGRVNDALIALQASLDIGQSLDLGAVYAACYAATGVSDVDLNISADVPVASTSLAELSWTISLVSP